VRAKLEEVSVSYCGASGVGSTEEVAKHPILFADWRSMLAAKGDLSLVIIGAAVIFSRLALGLSGFETGASVMPLIDGGVGLSRGAISKIVDKLETKGWIRTESNQVDSRFRLLSLTREGRRSLPFADANDAHFLAASPVGSEARSQRSLTRVAVHHGIHDVPSQ